MTELITYCNRYSHIGDLTVITTCIVLYFLTQISYISKSKAFTIFKQILFAVMGACYMRLFHYRAARYLAEGGNISVSAIYALRYLYYAGVFTGLFLFFIYLTYSLQIDRRIAKHHIHLVSVFYSLALLYGLIEAVGGMGFQIQKQSDGYYVMNEQPKIFFCLFAIQTLLIFFMLWYYRKRIFKQILIGICFTNIMSCIIVIKQYIYGNVSYTTIAFLYPLFALLYLVHASPYDIEIGTMDMKAFYQLFKEYKRKNEPFIATELYFPKIEKNSQEYPKDLRNDIRDIFSKYFRSTMIFQISSGRILLIADASKNREPLEKQTNMLRDLHEKFLRYGVTYKALSLAVQEFLTGANDYISISKYFGAKIQDNTWHIITEDECREYNGYEEILRLLEKINKSGDLNDPHVLVYTQPVYHLKQKCYDTAEALVRLKTDEGNLLMPSEFIRLAEKYHYIRPIGYIMLYKVANQIRRFLEEGYKIGRISVNFCISDFTADDFCDRVLSIIENAGISPQYIAIEITETQDDREFYILKEKMLRLKKKGIRFYLDDFGTGYSNYERILELPFDIIKFDRSLVNSSSASMRSERMITNMATMFKDMDYAILYEGVETEEDILRCQNMYGEYLQGFHYSKPVPIEELVRFLARRDIHE